jgi:lactoylglutathione lyase
MPNYSYHHIHLTSPDPAKTARFYQDIFDAEQVRQTENPDGSVSVDLNLGGVMILVMPQSAEAKTVSTERGAISGLEHIGIRTDDMDTTVANLKANGVKFRDEVIDFRPGVRIAFFWAPEDVLVELVEIKPRV